MIEKTAAVATLIAALFAAPATAFADYAPMTTYKVCSDSPTGNNVRYYDDLGSQEVMNMSMVAEDGLYCATIGFYPDEYQVESVAIIGDGSLGYASCSIRHGSTVVASSRDYSEYGNAYASCSA